MITIADLKKVLENCDLPDDAVVIVGSDTWDEYASAVSANVDENGKPLLVVEIDGRIA